MTTDRHTKSTRNSSQRTNGDAEAPPHNLDAEAALLGAAMLSVTALEIMATKTAAVDYYSPAHASIAEALIEAFEDGRAADPVTIADSLARRDRLEQIGGPSTLITLQSNTPATSNAGRYAEIVHDHATLRRLMQASIDVRSLAASKPFDVHAAVEAAQQSMAGVAAQNGARSFSTMDIPDIAAILAGDIKMEEPSFLLRTDGKALLYAGKMHVLQAEAGTGKSWIALHAAVEVLRQGGATIYIDYEDSVGGIVQRLLALGASADVIKAGFSYVRPTGPLGTSERAELMALFTRTNPDLVIIDGVAEALSRDGFDEDKNSDVVKWIDSYPRWISQMGAAVLMLDHLAKDKERQGRHARGAGHKLAAVDGIAYKVQIQQAFSRHRSGAVKLTVAKDRPGAIGEVGAVAAVIRVDPSSAGEVVRLSIEPAPEQVHVGDSWKPTRIMERISREVEESKTPLTPKLLLDLVAATTKPRLAQEAYARLKAENFLSTYKMGSTVLVRMVKPYRAGDAPIPPEHDQQAIPVPPEEYDELAERRRRREEHPPDA